MGYDTWIEEMIKDIEKDKPADDSKPINLKESDLDKIADRVITKLSEVSTPKPDENDEETNDIELETENNNEE